MSSGSFMSAAAANGKTQPNVFMSSHLLCDNKGLHFGEEDFELPSAKEKGDFKVEDVE